MHNDYLMSADEKSINSQIIIKRGIENCAST